jgi:hypothetical protein
LTDEPIGYDDGIATPTGADDAADRYRQGCDHVKGHGIHSLRAVNDKGEALRADGAVAPQKDVLTWRGE